MRLFLLAPLLFAAACHAASPAAAADGGTTAAAAAAAASSSDTGSTSPLRIWIDEFFWAGGETALLHEAIAASGGAAVLAGATRNPVLALKSYQQAAKADVLWTGHAGCYKAFRRRLNATHAVACVPGTHSLTDKAALASSLEAAYGPAAWGLLPRTFRLPHQFGQLAVHLKQEQQAGQGSLWVLKEDVHRGKGVAVASPARTLLRALEASPRRGGGTRHVMAQRFMTDQMLVGDRPFYIRMWVVLMGADPARAYLWDGGVVVFGQQQQQQEDGRQQGSQPADPNALIVNLWTQDRAAAAPWSLGQLEDHLAAGPDSTEGAARLRRRLHAAVAATLAAGLPNVRRAAAGLAGFQGGSFEVLGLDFLLDASERPWLVEVNAMPSMARKLVGCSMGDAAGASDAGGGAADGSGLADSCQSANPFDVQKEGFVRALLRLLMARHRQLTATEAQAEGVLQAASAVAAEEQLPPCIGAPQLRQLLALQDEQATAQQLGLVPLMSQLYGALECMAQAQPSNTSSWCAVLADLPPPLPKQQQREDQPGGSEAALLGRLLRWGDWLKLEAAALLPRLLHPRVAWRLFRAPAAAVAPQPGLTSADRRMLAWLRRGSPQLDSVVALAEFCEAGADA